MKSLRLTEGVRMRRESFGGLVHNPRTGTTVDLDREAYRLLELAMVGISLDMARNLIHGEGLKPGLADGEVQGVVGTLCALGLTELRESSANSVPEAGLTIGQEWPVGSKGSNLSAPEAVHWAITYRCGAGCPDCYAARHRERRRSDELTATQALDVVDRIAQWGVFQLAIGGGEPLVREDLEALVRYASEKGLAVHLTTSGDHLTRARLESLSEPVTCLQVGIRHRDLFAPEPSGQAARLDHICDSSQDLGLILGANLILCRTVLERFEEAVLRLVDMGFHRVTLLRYKPPATVQQWKREAPDGGELERMEERIRRIISHHPDLSIRLDCALSFLQRKLPSEQARKGGLRGCVAGARIIAISPNGSIHPCSQLVDPLFRAGHILHDNPDKVWSDSKVLLRLRSFRWEAYFRRTACGMCRAVEQCGGCRVFTNEGLGPDPGCPGAVLSLPVKPPLAADQDVAR